MRQEVPKYSRWQEGREIILTIIKNIKQKIKTLNLVSKEKIYEKI